MEGKSMVMVDPQLFQSEWFVNLPVDDRYMYLYLLMTSDNKIGTFEWNERMINFCANTVKHYTKEDILKTYGNRIQEVPDHPNTLIIVSYLKFNWLKDGRELDPNKNLDKAILKQLARYGLTVDMLNKMEGKPNKIRVKEVRNGGDDSVSRPDVVAVLRKQEVKRGCSLPETSVTDKDVDEMFDGFWSAYPGPRKQDKRKCHAKFAKCLRESHDAVALFNKIMAGLDKWKLTDTWTKDDGRFICAPLVWLNNERWDAEVQSGNPKGNRGTANANCRSTETDNLF